MVRKGGEEGDRQGSSQVAPLRAVLLLAMVSLRTKNQTNGKTPNAIDIMVSPDL